jgi:hypothetical protein
MSYTGMNIFPQKLAGVGMAFRFRALKRVMPEPWLLTMGGVHSQMNGLVLEKVVALGTLPLKQKGLNLWLASCLEKDKKKTIFVFL